MNTKLFTIRNLPLYYNHGKSARKIMMNAILSMQWHKRKSIHDNVQNVMECRLASIEPIAVGKEDRFRISYGYYRDKSTGNVDIDGFAYLGKVINDSIANKLGINDSIHRIIETRYCYLGQRDKEELIVQVEKVDSIVVEKKIENSNETDKKYIIIGFRYPDSKDWLDCIDTKTGGKCVVHKDLL